SIDALPHRSSCILHSSVASLADSSGGGLARRIAAVCLPYNRTRTTIAVRPRSVHADPDHGQHLAQRKTDPMGEGAGARDEPRAPLWLFGLRRSALLQAG